MRLSVKWNSDIDALLLRPMRKDQVLTVRKLGRSGSRKAATLILCGLLLGIIWVTAAPFVHPTGSRRQELPRIPHAHNRVRYLLLCTLSSRPHLRGRGALPPPGELRALARMSLESTSRAAGLKLNSSLVRVRFAVSIWLGTAGRDEAFMEHLRGLAREVGGDTHA